MNSDRLLVIASRNPGKKREIRAFLADYFSPILGLDDIGFNAAIAEEGDTFQANAMHKARTVFQAVHRPVLADDSGLCVIALNGAPGVRSARYAGKNATDQRNMDKLLTALEPHRDRRAYFACSMVLYLSEEEQVITHGRVNGRIVSAPAGANGFGYDPVFFLPEHNKTMAQLTLEQKNALSHRARALQQLINRLAARR